MLTATDSAVDAIKGNGPESAAAAAAAAVAEGAQQRDDLGGEGKSCSRCCCAVAAATLNGSPSTTCFTFSSISLTNSSFLLSKRCRGVDPLAVVVPTSSVSNQTEVRHRFSQSDRPTRGGPGRREEQGSMSSCALCFCCGCCWCRGPFEER